MNSKLLSALVTLILIIFISGCSTKDTASSPSSENPQKENTPKEEPLSLKGPATVSSIASCLGNYKNTKFVKKIKFKNYSFGITGRVDVEFKKPANYSYSSGTITVYLDSKSAKESIYYSNNSESPVVQVQAETPNLILIYPTSIPDNDLAAMKICSKENY